MSSARTLDRASSLVLPAMLACALISAVVCAAVLRGERAPATVARDDGVQLADEPSAAQATRTEIGAVDERAAGGACERQRSKRDELVRLEATAPGTLDARAADVLVPGVAANEQVALLFALYDSGSPRALAWFERAVRTLPDDSSPHGESTASFALGFLYDRAQDDARARESLASLAADAERVPASLRARAVARVAQLGEPAELRQLRLALRGERDAAVTNNALAALRHRRDEWEALCILREHGCDAADAAVEVVLDD